MRKHHTYFKRKVKHRDNTPIMTKEKYIFLYMSAYKNFIFIMVKYSFIVYIILTNKCICTKCSFIDNYYI